MINLILKGCCTVRKISVCILFIFILSICGCTAKIETIDFMPTDFSDSAELSIQSYNIPAPDFTLKDIYDNDFCLSDFRGETVVLCFFASWNTQCEEEFEFLSQTKKDFPNGVFYAISTQENTDMSIYENKEDVLKFVREHGLDLPVLFDEDTENSVYQKLYYVRTLPATFVIDANGNIRNILTSIVTDDSSNPYSDPISNLGNRE